MALPMVQAGEEGELQALAQRLELQERNPEGSLFSFLKCIEVKGLLDSS
jgi:hypothetical protein